MPKTVGVIRISLNAGTAEFLADMDKANAKLLQFGHSAKTIDLETPRAKAGQLGREFQNAGGHGVTGVQAVSGALRVLEGGITNNLRAAERFTANVLGLGRILQTAFPLIGAIAFLGVITKLGEEVHKQYTALRDYGEKSAGAWRDVQAPLRKTNDELDLSNIKLKNQIAVLEGRHQNTLVAALHAAKVEADDLADSLQKDLDKLYQMFTQTDKNLLQRIFTGTTSEDIRETIGGKTGAGGDIERIAEINRRGYSEINQAVAAGDPAAVKAAQKKLDDTLVGYINSRQGWIAQQIQVAHNFETGWMPERKVATEDFSAPGLGVVRPKGSVYYTGNGGAGEGVPIPPGPPQTDRLRDLGKFSEYLDGLKHQIEARRTEGDLRAQEQSLSGAKTDARQDRPFDNKMAALKANLAGIEENLKAIGKGEEAKILAEAFGSAAKSIEEVDKALGRINPKLHTTPDQQSQIRDIELKTAQAKADEQWKTKLEGATTSINEQVRAQELLTAAIGKGYEATKAANVETRLMLELGQHFNDAAWMKLHEADVNQLRSGYGRDFDAAHAKQSAEAVDKLRDEIELERELAAAQREGAEALRQATLAAKLRKLTLEGATKEQLRAEIELYNAQRSNAIAGDVAKIGERIEATKRLTDALLGGAEAERKAALENKYAQIRRDGDESIPGVIGVGKRELAERAADAGDRQREITAEALKSGQVYQNELDLLAQQIAALEKVKKERGDTLEIELALRDLENKRLDTLAKESLALRGARDGVRAFFIEMQRDAKSTAEIVYEALNSSLDRVSDNLAHLVTGQKTDWAGMLKEIGTSMVKSEIKSQLQRGIGALGKKFGIDLGGTKPDGTAANPLWVRIAGMDSTGQNNGTAGTIAGTNLPLLLQGVTQDSGSGRAGRFTGNFLKTLLELGMTAGMEEHVTSSIDFGGQAPAPGGNNDNTMDFGGFMAGGGTVSPDQAYIVGDEGMEVLTGASGRIVSNAELQRTFGGGGVTNHYNIDARGADLGARNRIARALEMTHKAAVSHALRAAHEMSRRRPGR